MAARLIIRILGFFVPLVLLVWQISEAAPPYPPEIQQRIDRATAPIICETETPRKVGTITYQQHDANWLIRIFTKDGIEQELWLNEFASWWSLNLGFKDKVYYFENGQWFNQDILPKEESQRLDRRLKFTGEEIQFFKECFEQKRKTAP